MSVRWPGAPPPPSCSVSQYAPSSNGVSGGFPIGSPPTLSSTSSSPALLRGRPSAIPTSVGGSAQIPLESLTSGQSVSSNAAVWCELDDLRKQFQQLQLSVDSDVLEAFQTLRRQTAELSDKVDGLVGCEKRSSSRPRSQVTATPACCSGDAIARIAQFEASLEALDKLVAAMGHGQTDRADHIEFRLSALDSRVSNIGLTEFKARFEDRLASFDERLVEHDRCDCRGVLEGRLTELDARIADVSKLDGRTQLADRLAGLAARVTEVASSDRRAELEERLSALDARVAEMGHELLLFVEERLGAMDADVAQVCSEQRTAAATHSDLLQRACIAEASVEKIREQVSRLLKQALFPTVGSETTLESAALGDNLAKLHAHVMKHSASSSSYTTPACTPQQEYRLSDEPARTSPESVARAEFVSVTAELGLPLSADQQDHFELPAGSAPRDVLGCQRSDGTKSPDDGWAENHVQELDLFKASGHREYESSPIVGAQERRRPRSGSSVGGLR